MSNPTPIVQAVPRVPGLPPRCLLLLNAYALAMRNHTLRRSQATLEAGKRAEDELVAYLLPMAEDAERWRTARAGTPEMQAGLIGSLREDWPEYIDAYR